MHRVKRALVRLPLAVCAALFFLPVLLIACGSVSPARELSALEESGALLPLIPEGVTLEHYYRLLIGGTAYLSTFWNSMWICLLLVGGQCAVSLVISFALWQGALPLRGVIRRVYAFLMLMPFQVTMLPNYILIRRLGLYNSSWALILPGVFSPLGVFLLDQFMRGMPQELIDAAVLDTSSPVRVLLYIVAPTVSHALGALALIAFAEGWNMVEQPLIFLKDAWRYPLSLLLNQQSGSLASTLAGAVVYMLPIYFLFRLFKDSLLTGVEGMKL